jgi:hypothetical protein
MLTFEAFDFEIRRRAAIDHRQFMECILNIYGDPNDPRVHDARNRLEGPDMTEQLKQVSMLVRESWVKLNLQQNDCRNN